MVNRLMLVVGNSNYVKELSAVRPLVESDIRASAEALGYGSIAETDPFDDVATWVVNAISSYLRDAAMSTRTDIAVSNAKASERGKPTAFD
jgi:hypothetical protein